MILPPKASAQNEPTMNTMERNLLSSGEKRLPEEVEHPSPEKRTKATTAEPEEDERRVKTESWSEEEHAVKISAALNEKEHTDKENPVIENLQWDAIQKHSVMMDLSLQDSDDEDDGDYNEDMPDTGMVRGRFKRAEIYVHIPIIEVVLWHPERNTWEQLSSLPISTVRSLIEKFNMDFLTRQKDRVRYQMLVKEKSSAASVHKGTVPCVRNCLLNGLQANTYGFGMRGRACFGCVAQHKLCSKLFEMCGAEKLAIFPLPESYRNNAARSEMAYWVRE